MSAVTVPVSVVTVPVSVVTVPVSVVAVRLSPVPVDVDWSTHGKGDCATERAAFQVEGIVLSGRSHQLQLLRSAPDELVG